MPRVTTPRPKRASNGPDGRSGRNGTDGRNGYKNRHGRADRFERHDLEGRIKTESETDSDSDNDSRYGRNGRNGRHGGRFERHSVASMIKTEPDPKTESDSESYNDGDSERANVSDDDSLCSLPSSTSSRKVTLTPSPASSRSKITTSPSPASSRSKFTATPSRSTPSSVASSRSKFTPTPSPASARSRSKATAGPSPASSRSRSNFTPTPSPASSRSKFSLSRSPTHTHRPSPSAASSSSKFTPTPSRSPCAQNYTHTPSPASSRSSLPTLTPSPPPDTKPTPPSTHEPATLHPHGLDAPVKVQVDNHWLYLFFRFCAERHAMYDRREAGVARDELTSDETMQSLHIGNVFRELDPSSKRNLDMIINVGDQSYVEVCFRLLLFTAFYNPDTWTAMCDACGGVPSWRSFDLRTLESCLHRRSMIERKKIYYGGFQLVPPTIYFSEDRNRAKTIPHYAASLRLVMAMMRAGLPDQLLGCRYAVDASEVLQTIPTLGGFLSLNILCELNNSDCYNFYYRNFATCGPGSRSYLQRIFGKSVINSPMMEDAGLVWVYQNQWRYWARLNTDPPHAHPLGLPPGMRVLDIENAMCWCHRYVNAIRNKGLRNMGEAGDPTYDAEVTETAAQPAWCVEERWAESSSKAAYKGDYEEVKERLGSLGDDVYEVEKVIARKGTNRSDKRGIFRVRWKGWTPEEDTWEPLSTLRAGAEEALQDWLDWEERVWSSIAGVKAEYPYAPPVIAREVKDE